MKIEQKILLISIIFLFFIPLVVYAYKWPDPVIENLKITSKDGKAIFDFTSTAVRPSIIKYGKTTRYGSYTSLSAPSSTHHHEIPNLSPGVVYHCKIMLYERGSAIYKSMNIPFTVSRVKTERKEVSKKPSGNSQIISSGKITNIKVENNSHQVKITWDTKDNSIGKIRYWAAGTKKDFIIKGNILRQKHWIILDDIQNKKNYRYKLYALDKYGNPHEITPELSF